MAEYLARRAAGAVASAGTHAVDGRAVHPLALQALLEARVDASGFRSQRLTPQLVEDASLVLTATRAQRAACVSMAPTRLGRVFTLRQFSRLAGATGLHQPTNVDGALEAIAAVRGRIQPVPPAHDEIADPVNGNLDDMRACLRSIERSLKTVLSVIALP